MRSHQRGLGGAFVAVVLILVAGVALAAMMLARTSLGVQRGSEVAATMKKLEDALIQFVAASGRLPCPANPAADDGTEVVGGAPGTCTHAQGTVPWRTIAARRDDSIDPWSGKISYRVYTGALGSLTQVGGTSMVQCDTVDLTPTAVTPVAGSAGGLCQSDSRITYRATLPASFLAGKGLHINDLGTNRTDVAYVLISHGPTGLGAYTTAGVQRDLPATGGAERANTAATGPFVIKAFSVSGMDSADMNHFDDYVTYRRIEDLVRTAGTYARDWPEEAASGATFNRAAVEAAVGTSVTPGSGVGQVSVNFTGVVASGLLGGTATQVAFDQASDGSWSGIGVASGSSAMLESALPPLFNEALRFEVERGNSKFAITLTNFGFYGGQYAEIAEFRFFSGGTQVGATRFGIGCTADGQSTLASFSVDAGVVFDRVDVTSLPALDVFALTLTGFSAFLVSEIKACPATEATCTTSLTTPGNTCGVA